MTDHSADSVQAPTDAGAGASDLRAVVGIGASAGGIAALQRFFARVPRSGHTAYVVVLHLSPEHDSHLAEVLQSVSPIPVVQVTGAAPLKSDRVYVVSPNHNLSITDGSIVTTEMSRAEQRRAPIDIFFRSLADVHPAVVVSVVLSGMGTDGSSGLKRVKEHGGLVVAQDPHDAEYADMPANAIATGLVDYVPPAAEMPAAIQAYQSRITVVPADPDPMPAAAPTDGLREILTLLRARTRHDFASYKPSTLARRINRRMHVRGVESAAEYAALVREQRGEADALMRDLLISVTQFFRDAGTFAVLAHRVIPRLFENKRAQDQVRAWVPGCATGEEAYSIAMLLC